jgi:hypothetical protein
MAYRFSVYCGLAVGQDTSPQACENSKRIALEAADRNLKSYSIHEINGVWRSLRERVLVIVYYSDLRTDITKVNALAHTYKHSNHQEAVMIVEEEVDIRFY